MVGKKTAVLFGFEPPPMKNANRFLQNPPYNFEGVAT